MNKKEAEIIYEASRPTDFPPVMKEWLLKKGFKKNIIERSHHTEWRYLHEIDVTVPDPDPVPSVTKSGHKFLIFRGKKFTVTKCSKFVVVN